MPSVWDEVDEKVQEAVANTAGEPFPERFEAMASELVFDIAIWVGEQITVDANAGFDPGAPPDPAFAAKPPPDPPDAGASDPSGPAGGDGGGGGGGGDGDGDGGAGGGA